MHQTPFAPLPKYCAAFALPAFLVSGRCLWSWSNTIWMPASRISFQYFALKGPSGSPALCDTTFNKPASSLSSSTHGEYPSSASILCSHAPNSSWPTEIPASLSCFSSLVFSTSSSRFCSFCWSVPFCGAPPLSIFLCCWLAVLFSILFLFFFALIGSEGCLTICHHVGLPLLLRVLLAFFFVISPRGLVPALLSCRRHVV